MSGQDRYIPGVPCWIDTTQPDPAAAAEFYGDLFGWELEDVMPADSPVKYYIGRRDGGDVAAVELAAGGRARGSRLEHVRVGRRRRRDRREGARGRRHGRVRAVRRVRLGAHGGLRRPGGRGLRGLAGQGAPRRQGRQRARLAQLQRPQHHATSTRPRRSTGRCSAGRSSTPAEPRCGRCPATATSWRAVPRGCARTWPRWALRSASRTWSRASTVDADTPPHWGVTFGVDDADAIAARTKELGGEVLVPPFDAPWVRMAIVRDPQGAVVHGEQVRPREQGPRNGSRGGGVRGRDRLPGWRPSRTPAWRT